MEKDYKYGDTLLYKMSLSELNLVKRYLDLYLANSFIQTSSNPLLLLVVFIKKWSEGIWFCVNYWGLNAITKKDWYLIPLIKETLAQFKGAKYFTKIDIRHAFYIIKMSKALEELTTFLPNLAILNTW